MGRNCHTFGRFNLTGSGMLSYAEFENMVLNQAGNLYVPPKTNMEPKNDGVEDEFPFQRDDFQVPC